jgi:hypothetical protein
MGSAGHAYATTDHPSTIGIVLVSFTALLVVLWGYPQPRPPDEGTGAHIFQLAVVQLVAATTVFVGTVDWSRPAEGPGQRPSQSPLRFFQSGRPGGVCTTGGLGDWPDLGKRWVSITLPPALRRTPPTDAGARAPL